MWYILIHPYAKFYDFESLTTQYATLIFGLVIASIFMTFQWVRAVMVLFLPSMIGNASQNYIILLLFIALLSNPVHNISTNAAETVRVIGCSLTMTFQQLKDRARLILDPIIAVLSDRNHTALDSLKSDLTNIKGLVLEIREEAELNRNESDKLDLVQAIKPIVVVPDKDEIYNDIRRRLKGVDSKKAAEIVDKTRDLIKNATFDYDTLGFRASLDTKKLKELARSSRIGSKQLSESNLTEILYENCMGVFRRAKGFCQDAVEELNRGCRQTVGPVLAFIFCSPTFVTTKAFCPFIMNQLIDENSVCSDMRSAISNQTYDPFNLTSKAKVDDVYTNLTRHLNDLSDDLMHQSDAESAVGGDQRFEIDLSLNEQTKDILFKVRDMVTFLKEKFNLRQYFYDLLLLLYELYTSYTFLVIILQAFQYHNNYLTQIRFDNHYITGQFFALDRRRRATGKTSVLPLTKEESESYITTLTCKRRTHEEQKVQKASCVVVIVAIVFILSLLYLDDIFYSILYSIHEHAYIGFKEMGNHYLKINVTGEGSIGRLVRSLTAGLNSAYDLDKQTNTGACLPVALATSNRFYLELTYLVLIYLGIDQISIYAMRLRRVTSAFFYPEKEQQRIAYLHKLITVQRASLARAALANYVDSDDGKASNDADDSVFSLRDAFGYIGNCVSDSLSCCRHPLTKVR